MTEPTRRLPDPEVRDDGKLVGKSTLTPEEMKTRGAIPVPPTKVMPVILVPGIMGSNLRVSTDPNRPKNKLLKPGEPAWRPPNGMTDGLKEAGLWEDRDAVVRQQILDGDTLEVDDSGFIEIPGDKKGLQANQMRNRWWGEVHWSSYGGLLCQLHENLNKTFTHTFFKKKRVPNDFWESVMEYDRTQWDAGNMPALTEPELEKYAQYQYPSVAMFASVKGYPDIAIRLDTSVNIDRLQDSLLVRDAQNSIKKANASNFKKLRMGARSINGLEGEEVLNKVKEHNGTSAHYFMWASMGKMHDVLSPKLTLELETGVGRPGEQINSSLSDEAVVELWDRVSSSIRLRPVSTTTKTSQTVPPVSVPLGTLAATDRVCPQSGLWECNESGEIQGGKQQFFRSGDIMPHAVLLGTSSILNRLRGEQPSHRIATVWKLLDYDSPRDADGGKATPGRSAAASSAPAPHDSGNPPT